MFLKSLLTLTLGSGMGVPLVSSLKKIFEADLMPKTLKNSDIKVEIKWTNAEESEKAASLIDNFGEAIKGDEIEKTNLETQRNKSSLILGVVLESSIYFEDDICKTLGFDSSLSNNSIGKEALNKISCETNLHRKEKIARGE